jgi:urease accessory protein
MAVAAGFLACGSPALAHSGHFETSFAAGLLHPLTGLDHLLAMVMVGLWAGLAFQRYRWVCPAAFVGFMLVGFSYGSVGGGLPFAELLIIASLAVLGLALAFDFRPPLAIAAPMVALFAIGHGFAHGAEMTGGNAPGFVAGFLITTALLHIAGLRLARLSTMPRMVGALGAVTAATLMWSS